LPYDNKEDRLPRSLVAVRLALAQAMTIKNTYAFGGMTIEEYLLTH